MSAVLSLAGLVAAIGGVLIATRIVHTMNARVSNEHGKHNK
jgi:hypothetical protein